MKTGISVLIFTFSNIYVTLSTSVVDITNASTSFIQTNELFSYLREVSDDFAESLLQRALVAASVNRNLFNIAEAISEDCQKTAKAIVDMYEELPIVVEVDKVIRQCSQQAVLTLKKSLSPSNPVEFICKSIEKDIATFLVLYPEFQYLKRAARLNKISGRPYYLEVPKSPVKAAEMFFREVTDLQVSRIVTIGVFVDHGEAKNDSDIGHVKVAQAILNLAKRADLASAAQRLFTKKITEISVKAIAETQQKNHKTKSSVRQFILFFVNLYRRLTMDSLDQAFTEDSMLKNEYKTAKNEFSGKISSL